jgi:hypothetical protein
LVLASAAPSASPSPAPVYTPPTPQATPQPQQHEPTVESWADKSWRRYNENKRGN